MHPESAISCPQACDGACGCSGLLAWGPPGLHTLWEAKLTLRMPGRRGTLVSIWLAQAQRWSPSITFSVSPAPALLGFAGCALALTGWADSQSVCSGHRYTLTEHQVGASMVFPICSRAFVPYLMPLGILFGEPW